MADFHNYQSSINQERDILTPEKIELLENTRRFFYLLKKPAIITRIIFVLIWLLWFASLLIGLMSNQIEFSSNFFSAWLFGSSLEQEALVKLGAKVNFLVNHGQYWRLVAPLFLHFGFLHIVFNSYALYFLGRIIENIYGKRRFLLIFFFSGISSLVASYYGSEQMSVGASGAIFGLLGAGMVVGFKYRKEIPPAFKNFFGRGMLPWIVLNLSLGLFIDGIDNYAHVGGLVAGVLLTFLLLAKQLDKRESGSVSLVLLNITTLLVLVMLLVTGFFMTESVINAASLKVPDDWHEVRDIESDIKIFVPDTLKQVKLGHGLGLQFLEPSLGFWVALERNRQKILDFTQVQDELLMQLKESSEIDISSINILETEDTIINEFQAKRIKLTFKLSKHPVHYVLEVWMIPSKTGLVTASCSGPRQTFDIFNKWCSMFIQNIEI